MIDYSKKMVKNIRKLKAVRIEVSGVFEFYMHLMMSDKIDSKHKSEITGLLLGAKNVFMREMKRSIDEIEENNNLQKQDLDKIPKDVMEQISKLCGMEIDMPF